jgi:predicted nucleic acid-binding protein
MSAEIFIDTNILIYAYDKDAGFKKSIASSLVSDLWSSGKGMLSTQVFQEFYVNVTKKITTPIPPAIARGIIENYLTWQVQLILPSTIIRASEYQERHHLSFWDAMILAAHEGRAVTLLSEDLNPGQIIEGIMVVNPFVEHPRP